MFRLPTFSVCRHIDKQVRCINAESNRIYHVLIVVCEIKRDQLNVDSEIFDHEQ